VARGIRVGKIGWYRVVVVVLLVVVVVVIINVSGWLLKQDWGDANVVWDHTIA
jgi:hypothetical protein